MLTELRKSIASNLYERTTSPLYGAFIVSWCFFNWKIIYVTFFIDSKSLDKNKIEWISGNLSLETSFLYPLYSTCFLILVMPFVSNAAYWLGLRFKKWKLDQKNIIEKKTLLTIEQSIHIRQEMAETEERFEKFLDKKNKEIKVLEIELDHLRNLEKPSNVNNYNNEKDTTEIRTSETEEDAFNISTRISENDVLRKSLERAMTYIQGGYTGLFDDNGVSQDAISFFESHKIMSRNEEGIYNLTEFGKTAMKYFYDKKF